MRVPIGFPGYAISLICRSGFAIRDFTAKSGRVSGLKVCAGGGVPKITLGITRLLEILGRDYGIEKPYWGPSLLADNFPNVTFISVNGGNNHYVKF